MCYSKFLRERSDEDLMDITAAPWEAPPDEEEVQEMLDVAGDNWQDERRFLRILLFWPTYLMHFGHRVAGCNDYTNVFRLSMVEDWEVDKYCHVDMPFHDFALNFNTGYSCTPFNNFRVHGTVWSDGETVCCIECIDYGDSDDFSEKQFHAWFDDPIKFKYAVMDNYAVYFCNRCSGFMHTLNQEIDCIVCENIVDINQAYAWVH
uniref:NS3 n=1 Tax=uncultured densovirus TaxID=748192 RepID=A0A7L7YQF7_9VIRU|nr:NS3 [uncultured densovirus]